MAGLATLALAVADCLGQALSGIGGSGPQGSG